MRKAKLQDAVNIFELVNSLSGDGTLLRRSYAEICENVRDFAVAESQAGIFLGCGALHLYGPHLAEVRSIVVKPEAKGQGAGGELLQCAARRGRVAGRGVRLPVYAHPGLLLPLRLPGRRPDGAAGQDLQGLPDLSAAVCLRRGRDGARADAEDRRAGAEQDSLSLSW